MKKTLKPLRFPVVVSILICLVVSLVIIGVRNMGGMEFLEFAAYDYYVRLKAKHYSLSSPIVLVTISEKDIQMQKRWPMTDSTLAHILKTIAAYQPRVIGLDIYRDIPVPPGEGELAEVFSENHNIVTVQKIGDDTSSGVPAPYILENAELVGFNDLPVDPGNVVRRGLLFLDSEKNVYNSFALLVALLYLRAEEIFPQPGMTNPEHLRIGRTTFVPFEANDGGYIGADARGYQFLLDYHGAHMPFQTFSLHDILSGEIAPEVIHDKVVLIGSMAESVKDFFTTPFSGFLGMDKKIYGVELHAHIVSQLLRASREGTRPIATVREAYEWYWIIFWGLIGGALGLWIRSFFRFSLLTASSLFLLVVITYYAFLSGWWIPSVPPGLSLLISSAMVTAFMSHREKVERASLMNLFSRHVSKDVAEAIWQQRDIIMSNGRTRSQKLIATVLFTDLKGFTSVSEKLDPQVLMDWLNEFMESMTQIVIENGGSISKYIGDSIMGVFGVPFASTTEAEISRDAINAVNSALAMEKELERLNSEWLKRNLPTTEMRIGIFTGALVAGSIGSTERMEYTILGDTVNIASRLESYNKDDGNPDDKKRVCRILIGEETLKYLNNQFNTVKVGDVSLKGKEEKITVYNVAV
jgi:adenylate cyclase